MTDVKKNKIKNAVSCYLMGCWPLIGFLLFSALPLIISFYLGFTELHDRNFLHAKWVGFENYKDLMSDALFFKAIINTIYSLLSVPLKLFVGLLVAMLMTSKRVFGKKAMRIIFFIPYLCSEAVVASTFVMLFDAEYGVINTILKQLGLQQQLFFRDERAFMPLMFILISWSSMGYYALLFYSALTNVPQEVKEAAAIDGASANKIFFKITVPLISPTTFYLFTTALIGGLQIFGLFQIVAGGMSSIFTVPWGPGNAGVTVVYYLYVASFTLNFQYGVGYGSAMAWILAIIVVIMTRINFKISDKWVHYD